MMVAPYAGQVPLVCFSVLHLISKYSISYYISNDNKLDTGKEIDSLEFISSRVFIWNSSSFYIIITTRF